MKIVNSKSFEHIHHNNLVGMGIIPLCLKSSEDAKLLGITGHKRYSIDIPNDFTQSKPGQDITVKTNIGKLFTCVARFDT